MSGGFTTPYRLVLPEFERRRLRITITTGSGASQGTGPETIGAQLRRGVPADVVIMSREGLNDLIAEGRIAAGTDVDLAQTPVGVAVRSGAPKPDVSTADAFKRTLLNAKSIVIPGSTSGIYLATDCFRRLGVCEAVKITARGAEAAWIVGLLERLSWHFCRSARFCMLPALTLWARSVGVSVRLRLFSSSCDGIQRGRGVEATNRVPRLREGPGGHQERGDGAGKDPLANRPAARSLFIKARCGQSCRRQHHHASVFAYAKWPALPDR